MSQLRLGLLGYGRIAELVHVPILSRLAGVRLVAVAEANADRRGLAARATSATVHENETSLLESRSVDAVVVCMPTPQHASAAVAAFDAGLHVYLEKPIATTADDAVAVVEAWRRAGTVGMAGLNFRHNPHYLALREHVRRGDFGRVVAVRSVFTSSPRALPAWKCTRATGGGVLLDLATHHLDLLSFVLSERVVSVQACVSSVATEDDTALVQCTLQSGVLYQGTFSLTTPESHQFAVHGDHAVAWYDRARDRRIRLTPVGGAHAMTHRLARVLDVAHPSALRHAVQPERSFEHALSAFVRAAQGESLPTHAPTLADGESSLAVVLAAEEAARTGSTVAVRYRESRG